MAVQETGISNVPFTSRIEKPLKGPINFSKLRKYQIVAAGTIFAYNGSLGASLPSGASSNIADFFEVSQDSPRLVLLNSLYLLGFAIGPMVFGPMSEFFGRRPVLIGTYLGYTFLTVGCALSPTFEALLAFRFLCGINGSAPNAVLGGLYSDIYNTPNQRGNAMAIFIFVAIAGPMTGPLISGYAVLLGWRWVFWIALVIAGAGIPFVLLVPETYLPILMEKWKNEDEELWRCHHIRAEVPFRFGEIFIRPYTMLLKEPIVLFTSLYLSVIYGVLFLFFQAYPHIFEGLYGFSNGLNGLAFIPMVFGSLLGLCVFLAYVSFHGKALAAGKAWASIEEYRRLPLACVAAPTIVAALFWLAWTSYTFIHPAVPMMAGTFFGFGYFLVFTAMLNYLTDAYKEDSASAQASASGIRAIMAVVLPFATTSMYASLGVHWANSLIGFIALALTLIPFAFIRYGNLLRLKSRMLSAAN